MQLVTLPAITHSEQSGVSLADLRVGGAFLIRDRRTVTDFDNVAASVLAMNTHPVHSDYVYAEASRFGKPLVVSPFLLSILVGFVTNKLTNLVINNVEVTALTFVRPVHPGDTITAEATIEGVEQERLTFSVRGKKASGEEFAQFRLAIGIQLV